MRASSNFISRDIADFPTETGSATSVQFENTFLTVGGNCGECDEKTGSVEGHNRDIVKFLPETSTWEVLVQQLPVGGSFPAFMANLDLADGFCTSQDSL